MLKYWSQNDQQSFVIISTFFRIFDAFRVKIAEITRSNLAATPNSTNVIASAAKQPPNGIAGYLGGCHVGLRPPRNDVSLLKLAMTSLSFGQLKRNNRSR